MKLNIDTGKYYQVSTLTALSLGYSKSVITVEELLSHGDTGLGTFEDVDGEMIVICECPRQYLAEAVKYIKEDMTQCVTGMPVPFLADAENSDCWYGKEIVVDLEVDEDGDIVEE